MIKFPWDCKDCPLLHTYDLSVDDLTHVCLWSKAQIDDCDRYKFAKCPLEKHDLEIRADERRKFAEDVLQEIQERADYYKNKNHTLFVEANACIKIINNKLKEQNNGVNGN